MRTKVLYVILALFVVLSGVLGGKVMADRPDGSPTAVDVVLRPEWAAKEGKDKNFYAAAANVARGAGDSEFYLVPVGKTLYITHFSFSIYASLAADSDLNAIGYAYITDAASPVYQIGGNGGGSMVLPKPFVIAGGGTFAGVVRNQSNHNCTVEATFGGYEVNT